MLTLSATDVAIAIACKGGTLTMTERPSRFGGTYVAICDEHGVIEVADDMEAAKARVIDIAARTVAARNEANAIAQRRARPLGNLRYR